MELIKSNRSEVFLRKNLKVIIDLPFNLNFQEVEILKAYLDLMSK